MVAAVLVAGSQKAAAHCLGLSHSTIKHHVANALQGGGGNHGAACVGPRFAAVRARGRSGLESHD